MTQVQVEVQAGGYYVQHGRMKQKRFFLFRIMELYTQFFVAIFHSNVNV